jgi:drug/metabolite transporter (DMT)-like permease
MTGKLSAYLDLTGAMVIVGSSVVFGKIITQHFPVFLASGLRFALAALFMTPLILIKEKRLPSFSGKDWLLLAVMAFCGQIIFTVFLLLGLRLTSALEAGLITSTTPAAMAAVAFLALGERLNLRQAAGVALAVLGVMAINGLLTVNLARVDRAHLLGNLLVCGAVLGEAVFLLLRKRISPAASSLGTSWALIVLGFIMFLPPALWQGRHFDYAAVPAKAWIAILYFGAVFTVVAYILWFCGVERVSGQTAGVFTAVMPVSAVTLSCIFLGEALTWSHVCGGLFVLAAIFLMTFAPPRTHGKAARETAQL